jgi:DNA-directed RNA polymerase II subunit RPB9
VFVVCVLVFSARFLINKHVAVDPTLPRTQESECSECGTKEAVFFTNPSKGEESMSLIFVCCNTECGHNWEQDQPTAKAEAP